MIKKGRRCVERALRFLALHVGTFGAKQRLNISGVDYQPGDRICLQYPLRNSTPIRRLIVVRVEQDHLIVAVGWWARLWAFTAPYPHRDE